MEEFNSRLEGLMKRFIEIQDNTEEIENYCTYRVLVDDVLMEFLDFVKKPDKFKSPAKPLANNTQRQLS